MVIMPFNEITVIALKKYKLVQIKRIYWLEFLLSYIYFLKVCMIVARDVDRIRQTMGNQQPEHLWCGWQCCCWIPSGSLHTHPCQKYFIFTGSISHSIKFRLFADPGCCRGGDRWEGIFPAQPSLAAGTSQTRNATGTGSIYLFCRDIVLCLLIIWWWFSTGRKGRSMWWCSIMCWKRGASGQTPCSYLMVGSWENDRHGVILEHFGLPRELDDVRERKPLGLWMQQHSPNVNFCAPCCRGGILSLFSIEISKAL